MSIQTQEYDELKRIHAEISQDAWRDARFDRALLAGVIEIVHILRKILANQAPETTDSVANVFSGDNLMDNALVFTVGQTSTDTLTPRLADGTTPSGGVVSNVAVTFSDPSASFVVNADETITFTAVAASTGPVSGSMACTVTDTDGAVSTWTIPFTVTTNGVVPPAQLTQSVANVFSTPA